MKGIIRFSSRSRCTLQQCKDIKIAKFSNKIKCIFEEISRQIPLAGWKSKSQNLIIPFLKRRKRNAPPITNISARCVNDGRPVGGDADDNSLASIAASVRFPETPGVKKAGSLPHENTNKVRSDHVNIFTAIVTCTTASVPRVRVRGQRR